MAGSYIVYVTRLDGSKKELRHHKSDRRPEVGQVLQIEDYEGRVEEVAGPPPKTEWCSGQVWCAETASG